MYPLGFGTFNPLLEKTHAKYCLSRNGNQVLFYYLERYLRATPNFEHQVMFGLHAMLDVVMKHKE